MEPITAQIEGMEWLIVLIIIAVLIFLLPRYIAPAFRSLGRAKGEYEKGKLEVEKELDAMKTAGKR